MSSQAFENWKARQARAAAGIAEPEPSPNARRGARTANDAGHAWEDCCRLMLSRAIALDSPVKQTSVVRRIGPGPGDLMAQKLAGPPDLRGTVRGTGRSFQAEAKSVASGQSFPLRKLTDSQRRDLVNTHDAGGLAGILVEIRDRDQVWWISAGLVALAGAGSSIKLADPTCWRLGTRSRWSIEPVMG